MISARRLLLLSLAIFLATAAPARAAGPSLFLTTTRGCLETGQNPVFTVGESLTVFFRVGSDTSPTAAARIFDILSDGRVGVFSLGQIPTNVVFAFSARVAPPLGIERLILSAKTSDGHAAQRSCSFAVVPVPPDGTTTPSTTRTPSATRTPRNTATPTPTFDDTLTGSIRSNRGCREDGDAATFALGESILLFFRVSSATVALAQTSIADIPASGPTVVFAFGELPTNTSFAVRGRIGPPLGTETVELRARAPGQSTATLDRCSFLVVAAAPMTPTRTVATRTATRTRTPQPTGTPTPTPTPTL